MFKFKKAPIIAIILIMALVMAPLSASAVDYSSHRMGKHATAWNEIYNNFVTAVQNTENYLTSLVAGLASQVLGFITTEDQLVYITATPVYSDADTFTLAGDFTDKLAANKVVLLDLGPDRVKFNTVANSSYNAGTTTCNLNEANLTGNLARVAVFATRSGLWPWGDGSIYSRDYGTPSQVTLQAVKDLLGPLEREVCLYTGTWAFSGKFTSPANLTLRLVRGALLDTSAIPEVAIADLSRASACVVSWSGHGLETGDTVRIAGIELAQWTAVNGFWTVTKIDADSFSIAVNTSTYSEAYNPAADPGIYAQAVKINGKFVAGDYQVISTAGICKLVFGLGVCDKVRSTWLGCGPSSSAANNDAALRWAADIISMAGGWILLPQGDCQLSDVITPLNPDADVFFGIKGYGTKLSLLLQTGTDKDTLRIARSAYPTDKKLFEFCDFSITGNLDDGNGITLTKAPKGTLRNLYVSHCFTGYLLGQNCYLWNVGNIVGEANVIGLAMYSNGITVDNNCQFRSNGIGIKIDEVASYTPSGIFITSSDIETNGTNVQIIKTSKCVIRDCYFESLDGADNLDIEIGSIDQKEVFSVSIDNIRFMHNGTSPNIGIKIWNGYGISITNCEPNIYNDFFIYFTTAEVDEKDFVGGGITVGPNRISPGSGYEEVSNELLVDRYYLSAAADYKVRFKKLLPVHPWRSTSANFWLSSIDYGVNVTTGASDKAAHLPDADTLPRGTLMSIRKVDTGAGKVVITPDGTQKIGGAATDNSIDTQWAQMIFETTGIAGYEWAIVSKNY
jgi:hypothetical protein